MSSVFGGALIDIPTTFLLIAFALSFLLLAKCVFQMLFGTSQTRKWLDKLCALLAIFLACGLTVDFISKFPVTVNPGIHALIYFSSMVFVLTISWIQSRIVGGTFRQRELARRPIGWALFLSLLGMMLLSAHRFYDRTSIEGQLFVGDAAPGKVEEVAGYVAVTDLGTALKLYRLDVEESDFEEYAAAADVRLSYLGEGTILRDPPDAKSNCHGWAFTGGQFLLRGNEVEQILHDNSYQTVPNPQSGDLIIYRNESGEILHTGVVRGVLDEGTVMIESKWGVDGRYLHLPTDQPYSQIYGYYRSSRPGHRIEIQKSSTALATSNATERQSGNRPRCSHSSTRRDRSSNRVLRSNS